MSNRKGKKGGPDQYKAKKNRPKDTPINPKLAPVSKPSPEQIVKEPPPPRLFGNWTGKTPLTLLNEWCQKNKWPRPQFYELKGKDGGYKFKVVLTDPTVKKKEDQQRTFFPREYVAPKELAKHTCAVVALHHLCSEKPLHRIMPPQFRSLWESLDVQAKDRQEHQQAIEKKEEERKEKKEMLQKRLERMPQVFMSPTARMLVEEVLREARNRNSSEKVKYEEGEKRGKGQSPAFKMLVSHFARMGWKVGHIEEALQQTWQPEEGEEGTEQLGNLNARNNPIVSAVLDWLCLHVPESELPKGFEPKKALEVGISAFGVISKSEKEAMQKGEGSTEVEQIDWETLSPEVKELVSLGFSLTESEGELFKGEGTQSALKNLYDTHLKSCLPEDPSIEEQKAAGVALSSEELEELRGDEIAALASIMADEFQETIEEGGTRKVSVKLSVDPPMPIEIFSPPSLDVYIPPAPENVYPYQLPMVLVRFAEEDCKKLPSGLLLDVLGKMVQEGVSLLGAPMIYSLVLWVQSNLSSTTRDFIKQKFGGPKAAPIPSPKPSPSLRSVTPSPSPSEGKEGVRGSKEPPKGKDGKPPRQQQHRMRGPKGGLSESEFASVSEQMKKERKDLEGSDGYQPMKKTRQRLPAWDRRQEIASLIRSNQVVVLTGSTGCGKSTQVPQFVLDDMIERNEGAGCNIIVTQPRRISALGLAHRVSQERCEAVGQTVGYQIRLESARSAKTRILFCTTGILLRQLSSSEPSSRELRGVSHIIVDEVHERSLESDFLLIILRELVKRRKDVKVILMSATLDAELFGSYFEKKGVLSSQVKVPVITIPGFAYPVTEFYLEDVIEMTGINMHQLATRSKGKKKSKTEKEEEEKRRKEFEESCCRYSERTRDALLAIDQEKIDLAVIESLIWFVCENKSKFSELKSETSAGAILVFFPGMADIIAMHHRLKESASQHGGSNKYWILPLHSSVSTEEQQRVFDRPPTSVQKIILSTNIAETSVTIDDVVVVINAGKMNELDYDPVSKMACLMETWVSTANALQRRGRAGRVQKGLCFHIYTRKKAATLLEQRPPEIMRVPLEQICLQIKLLHVNCTIAEFLQQALQPPNLSAIQSAVAVLREVGALEKDNEKLTPLGYHLASLPVDVHIGKLMLFGAIFQCIDPILTIAAFMNSRSPFVAPIDKRDEANKARFAMATAKSDHLTLLTAYKGWLTAKDQGNVYQYCNENFLSHATLKAVVDLKKQYVELLSEIGFLEEGIAKMKRKREHKMEGDIVRQITGDDWNANSHNYTVIKAVLCCGLYPNVVQIKSPQQKYKQVLPGTVPQPHDPKDLKFFTKDDGRVFVHPRSVNFSVGEYESPWLLFSEKVKTSKVFIRQSTMVSHYPLLLFGGQLSFLHDINVIKVDEWIQFRAEARIGVFIKEIRGELDKLLTEKINNPSLDIAHTKLVHVIIQLLSTDGLIGPQEAARWT